MKLGVGVGVCVGVLVGVNEGEGVAVTVGDWVILPAGVVVGFVTRGSVVTVGVAVSVEVIDWFGGVGLGLKLGVGVLVTPPPLVAPYRIMIPRPTAMALFMSIYSTLNMTF